MRIPNPLSLLPHRMFDEAPTPPPVPLHHNTMIRKMRCLYAVGDILMVMHVEPGVHGHLYSLLVRVLALPHPVCDGKRYYVEHIQSTPYLDRLKKNFGAHTYCETQLSLPNYAAIEHRYE